MSPDTWGAYGEAARRTLGRVCPDLDHRTASRSRKLVDLLETKGVALRVLDFSGTAVDTRGAAGRLMLNMFAAMAQFEREMMLERQREGIAKAKAQGKYKGRKPTARA